MKRSIFIAAVIFILVAGWIGSGQITNVKAQDEDSITNETNEKFQEVVKNDNNENKVEVKEFKFSQIDQSIDTSLKKINMNKLYGVLFHDFNDYLNHLCKKKL